MQLFKKIIFTLMLVITTSAQSEDTLPTIKVYKSPTCGCCSEWVKHLEENGFEVTSHNVQNLDTYKKQADLPYGMGSCHTAFVDGYAVEGHVPASDIKRMLSQKPDIRGISVPGMPMGSPGMEYGNRKDAYKVISYTKDGETAVYAEH